VPIPFKFDEVGIWSELKLQIVEKYGSAYTGAFAKQRGLKKFYVDAFSGAGVHISKRSGGQIDGSPARALKTTPSFDGFYFIDMDAQKTAHLRMLCANRSDVHIETGDASKYLTETLLPTIKYEDYKRALCLFDPYGLHLEWRAMEMAGQSRAIDMFLNFPVMDMNRNAIWRNPSAVPKDGIDRMNRFWGDESWREAAYTEHPQGNLFGAPDIVKQGNDDCQCLSRKAAQSGWIPVRPRASTDEEQHQCGCILLVLCFSKACCAKNHRHHFQKISMRSRPQVGHLIIGLAV
jgi:three-Cys-motif partner protein